MLTEKSDYNKQRRAEKQKFFKEIGIANKYDSKAQETVVYNRSSEEKVIRHCPDSV